MHCLDELRPQQWDEGRSLALGKNVFSFKNFVLLTGQVFTFHFQGKKQRKCATESRKVCTQNPASRTHIGLDTLIEKHHTETQLHFKLRRESASLQVALSFLCVPSSSLTGQSKIVHTPHNKIWHEESTSPDGETSHFERLYLRDESMTIIRLTNPAYIWTLLASLWQAFLVSPEGSANGISPLWQHQGTREAVLRQLRVRCPPLTFRI